MTPFSQRPIIGTCLLLIGGLSLLRGAFRKERFAAQVEIGELPAAAQISDLEFQPARRVVDPIKPDQQAVSTNTQIMFTWQLLATKPLAPKSLGFFEALRPRGWLDRGDQLLDLVPMAKGDQPAVAILPSTKRLNEAISSGRYFLELGPSAFITRDTSESCPLYSGCWAPPMPGLRITSAKAGEKRRRLVVTSIVTDGSAYLSSVSPEPFEFELDDGSTAVIPLLIRARNKSPQSDASKTAALAATPRYYRDIRCLLTLTMQLVPAPAAGLDP